MQTKTNSQRNSFEVEQIQPKQFKIIRYHNICQLTMTIFSLGLGPFYFGYCLVYLSAIRPSALVDAFGDDIKKATITAFLLGQTTLGAAVGALVAPFFMNFLSRRQYMLAINAFAFVVGCVIMIPNIYVLGVCRFFQGFCLGQFMAITPIYINELAPKQLMGRYGVFTQLSVNTGILVGYLIGFILYAADIEPGVQWRICFAFPQLTIVIQVFLFWIQIPQSPNSYIFDNKNQLARDVVKKFIRDEYIDQVMRQKIIEVSLQKNKNKEKKLQAEASLSSERSNTRKNSLMNKNGYSQENQLKVNWRAKFLGFQLPLMQQLTGTNGIVTQAGTIVGAFNATLAIYTPLILMTIQFFTVVVAVFVVAKLGRRTITLFGNLTLGLCDIILGVFLIFIDWAPSQYIIMITLVIFMIIFGLSVGPVVWMYVPQIIQSKLVPFATVANWLGASVCIILLPIIAKAFNGFPYPAFFAFAVWTLASFVINFFMMKQTKGLTTQQIVKMYNKQD